MYVLVGFWEFSCRLLIKRNYDWLIDVIYLNWLCMYDVIVLVEIGK